jgi:hypothetical protein
LSSSDDDECIEHLLDNLPALLSSASTHIVTIAAQPTSSVTSAEQPSPAAQLTSPGFQFFLSCHVPKFA